MDNQHRHITGYRELTAEDIGLMNEVKGVASDVEKLVLKLTAYPGDINPVCTDQRWVSIARTHLQQGFMALTRAIAKPTTF